MAGMQSSESLLSAECPLQHGLTIAPHGPNRTAIYTSLPGRLARRRGSGNVGALSAGHHSKPRLDAWLAVLGAALVLSLVGLLEVLARPPPGLSPRLGPEPDVTALFPGFWRALPPASGATSFQLSAVAAMLACWAVYVTALVLLRRSSSGPRTGLVLAVVTVAAHALLITAPPVTCGDVYHYALFGRMVNRSTFNPYLTPGAAMADAPFLRYASWPELASHYGAAFTWLSSVAARAGGDRVLATALAFKTLAALFGLAACGLVRRLSMALEGDDGSWALCAYAWNPLVLVETAALGHNDAVMLALALAGLLLAVRGRPWLGFAAMVVSADIKLVSGVLALLFAAHFVAQAPGPRARVGRALGLAATAAGVLLALWLPFWEGGRAFAAAHELMFTGGPRVDGATIGWMRTPVALAAGAILCAGMVLAARGGLPQLVPVAATSTLALLVVFPWRWSWYALSPIALYAVSARTRPRLMLFAIAVAWGAILMLRYTFAHSPLGGP